jgi:hypothetical protein
MLLRERRSCRRSYDGLSANGDTTTTPGHETERRRSAVFECCQKDQESGVDRSTDGPCPSQPKDWNLVGVAENSNGFGIVK